MPDTAFIISRMLEHKIAIAENNDQNTLIVTLDVLKVIVAQLKEQDELLYKKQKDIDKLCNEISEWKHKFHDISMKEQEAVAPLTIDDAVSEIMDKHYKRLKEQETEWEHLWDAPDGTFKGRCKKCGFVHFFIEGHDTQYKFCPQCGEQKQEL